MKRILRLLFPLLCLSCFAQVPVAPATIPHITFVNGSGQPCASCTLATYIAGTTTPQATYTDSTGTSQNTNPIVLDAAGGANIWLGSNSYKFILKDTTGATIWSVDNVNAGSLFPCSTAGAIQIANSTSTGLTCDPSITINTTTHTINVGTLPTNHVTIGALGAPTSWTFDTTSPATAAASLGLGSIGSGTSNQIAIYPVNGNNVQGSSTIPDGITAITRAPTDNSTNPATTAYVANPGGISPTALLINGGSTMTGNQGTGALLQHSTGATVTGDCAMFDAAGNTTDSTIPCTGGAGSIANPGYWTFADGLIFEWATGTTESSGSQAFQTISLPHTCPTAILSIQVSTNWYSGSSDDIMAWQFNATAGATTSAVNVVKSRRGDDGTYTSSPSIFVICH